MNKKLRITRNLQRAAALPYNHFVKNEVTKIRRRYGIPESAEQAALWLSNYVINYFGRGWTENVVNPMEVFIMYTPLGLEIKSLGKRFGLPGLCLRLIVSYLVENEQDSLTTKGLGPITNIDRSSEGGFPTLDIKLLRISPWITKKDWDNIWQNSVKAKVDELRRNNPDYRDIIRTRFRVEKYCEQMKRWARWYQLSEVEGLGPTEALARWEKENPTERRIFDQSTVTKAIKEFKEIITPKPDNV
jgi:hypothetical protein